MRVRTIVVSTVAAVAASLAIVGATSAAQAATTPFKQSFQAEAWDLGNGAKVVKCGFCSGGARVTHLGGHSDGVVTIAVRVPQDGWYSVTVYYVSGSTRDLVVNTKRLNGLNSGGWDKVAKRSVRLFLPALNGPRAATIDLGYGTGGKAPDVDKVVVSS